MLENNRLRSFLPLFVSILIPLMILLSPTDWLPIAGLSLVEQRMLAILAVAVLFWVLEPIPIFATSVLIIGLELFLISDKGLIWFRVAPTTGELGSLLSATAVMQTFASPIIILFLGGFFLALAATKYQLDINLARVILQFFGQEPSRVMLGLMLITATFSMFMSNTATTAMMIAILAPVLQVFRADDPGRIGFALCIPFAANVGGLGTPIGSPPNAVAMKYLTGDMEISFSEWMLFGVPFALVMLLFIWKLLLFLFPPRDKVINLQIQGKFLRSWQAIVVYLIFGVTILLWLSGKFHGMSAYVVAMIPVLVFVITQIITKDDLKRLSWDVLWLISGGIALGLGLQKTGLSTQIIATIPFASLSPLMIVLLGTGIALLMATLMSNTATANLLLPMMAALGAALPALAPYGGNLMLILAVTLTCSLGMALPISTPPNAMAYATGMVDNRQMLRAGGLISLVGLLFVYFLLYLLQQMGFFSS